MPSLIKGKPTSILWIFRSLSFSHVLQKDARLISHYSALPVLGSQFQLSKQMSGTENCFLEHQPFSFKHVSLCIFSQENPSIYFCALSPNSMMSCRMPGFGPRHLEYKPFHSTPMTLCFWITPSSSSQLFHLCLVELLAPEMRILPLLVLTFLLLPVPIVSSTQWERWPLRPDRPGGVSTPLAPLHDSGPWEPP